MKKYHNTNIKIFTEDDEQYTNFLNGKIEGNTCLISTNICGRGADIKPADGVLQSGGLHVCLTYLPANIRIEKQAFGRAARAGAPGTAQLILNREDVAAKLEIYEASLLSQFESWGIDQIRKRRDFIEKKMLEEFSRIELPKTKIKDKLYTLFCELLNKLSNIQAPGDAHYKRKAVEERWGIFQKKINFDKPVAAIYAEYEDFKKTIIEEYQLDTVIKNPYYYINLGMDLLVRASQTFMGRVKSLFTNSLYLQAIEAFESAIKLDPNCCFTAHYNIVYALIKIASGTYKEGNYKEKAKYHARQVIEIVEKLIHQTESITTLLSISQKNKEMRESFELLNQQNTKIQALKLLAESAHKIITDIEISQKLIDVTFEGVSKSFHFKKLSQKNAQQAILAFKEPITLSFNSLSAHSDIWTSYQAKNTFKLVDKGSDFSIEFENVPDSDKLKSLLPINKDLKKEAESKGKKENEKRNKEALTFSDKLKDFQDSAHDFFNNVARGFGKIAAPISRQYNRAIDYLYYQGVEKIPVSLKIRCKSLDETQNILSEIKKNKEERETKITFYLDNLNAKFTDAILKSHHCRKAKLSKESKPQSKIKGLNYTTRTLTSSFDEETTITFQHLGLEESQDLLNKLTVIFQGIEETSELWPSLTAKFSNLQQKTANSVIELGTVPMSLSFEDISKEAAIKVIYLTEKDNQNAIFSIKNLTQSEAEMLIQKADRTEQDFHINLKPVEDVVPTLKKSKMELLEYQLGGFSYFFEIKEKNPMPWRSFIALALFGIAQLIAGIVVTGATFGFATPFGIALIAEGIGDLVRAVSCLVTREFSWGTYAIQKTISLTISFATASYAANELTKYGAIGAELIDDAAMQVVQNGVIIKQAMQNGYKVAGRQIAATATEMICTKSATLAIDHLSDYTLEAIKPKLTANANRELDKRILDGHWKRLFNRICAVDRFLDSKFYTARAILEAKKIITSMRLSTAALRMLSSEEFLEFEQRYDEALRSIVSETQVFSKLLFERYCNKGTPIFSEQEAIEICKILTQKKILSPEASLNLQANSSQADAEKFEEIDLGNLNCYRSYVIGACQEFSELIDDDLTPDKISICRQIAEMFSSEIFKICEATAHVTKTGATCLASALISIGTNKIKEGGEVTIPKENLSNGEGQSLQISMKDFKDGLTQKLKEGVKEKLLETASKEQTKLMQDKIPAIQKLTSESPLSQLPLKSDSTHKIQSLKHSIAPGPGLPSQNADKLRQELQKTVKDKMEMFKQNHNALVVKLQSHPTSLSFTNTTDFKIAFSITLTMIKEGFVTAQILSYQQLDKYKATLSEIAKHQTTKEFGELYGKILEEEKKIVKTYLGVLLIEIKQYNNLWALDTTFSQYNQQEKEIQNELTELFIDCMKDPGEAYILIENRFNYYENKIEMIRNLFFLINKAFIGLNKTLANIQKCNLSKIELDKVDLQGNISGVMTRYFDHLETKNYSECVNLFVSGQLGEKGFIAGTIMQGLFTVYGEGQLYHHRMQLVLANLASEVIKGQTHFQTKLLQVQASYAQLTKIISEHYKNKQDDVTKRIMDQQERLSLMMMDPKWSDEQIKIHAASIAHTQDKLQNILKAYYSAVTSLVEANTIPQDFVEKCMEAQKSIMQSFTSSLADIAKLQSGSLKSLIGRTKDAAFKMIEGNTPEKPSSKTITLSFSKDGSRAAMSGSEAGAGVSSTIYTDKFQKTSLRPLILCS